MSVSDPIADMLTRIRNAGMAQRESVAMPWSRIKEQIAALMAREGFIADFTVEGQSPKKQLVIYLKYDARQRSVFLGLRRESRPGLRRYVPAAKIPRVLRGLGVAIVSTSTGIVTDREARARGVGGEVLCRMW